MGLAGYKLTQVWWHLCCVLLDCRQLSSAAPSLRRQTAGAWAEMISNRFSKMSVARLLPYIISLKWREEEGEQIHKSITTARFSRWKGECFSCSVCVCVCTVCVCVLCVCVLCVFIVCVYVCERHTPGLWQWQEHTLLYCRLSGDDSYLFSHRKALYFGETMACVCVEVARVKILFMCKITALYSPMHWLYVLVIKQAWRSFSLGTYILYI